MRAAALAIIVAISFVAVCASDASARRIEIWTYEGLFKEADLVVIAKVTGGKDNGEKTKLGGWDVQFIGTDTAFKVESTLKGKAPEKLTVLHFRLPDGTQ